MKMHCCFLDRGMEMKVSWLNDKIVIGVTDSHDEISDINVSIVQLTPEKENAAALHTF